VQNIHKEKLPSHHVFTVCVLYKILWSVSRETMRRLHLVDDTMGIIVRSRLKCTFGDDAGYFPQIHLHELAGTQVCPCEPGAFQIALDFCMRPRKEKVRTRIGLSRAKILNGCQQNIATLVHLIQIYPFDDSMSASSSGAKHDGWNTRCSKQGRFFLKTNKLNLVCKEFYKRR
jgi:hypothetical protein